MACFVVMCAAAHVATRPLHTTRLGTCRWTFIYPAHPGCHHSSLQVVLSSVCRQHLQGAVQRGQQAQPEPAAAVVVLHHQPSEAWQRAQALRGWGACHCMTAQASWQRGPVSPHHHCCS